MLVAGGAVAYAGLLFVLLAIVVNSCRKPQHENALKEYKREVSTIAQDSAQQVRQQAPTS